VLILEHLLASDLQHGFVGIIQAVTGFQEKFASLPALVAE